MGKRILGILASLVMVCAMIPSIAFAVPTWNDSSFLAKAYEPSIMRWQSNSYVSCSGGAGSHADTWGEGLPVYSLPTGGAIRFHNVGYDVSGNAVDLEFYGQNTMNFIVSFGTVTCQPIRVGDVCEFWFDSSSRTSIANANVLVSLYRAGTNTLAHAKLSFGVYDIDAGLDGHSETCWLNSSNATMYAFAGNELAWSGNKCWAPYSFNRGDDYDRSTACYMVSQAAQISVGFSGKGCGMCYSFQGASITPDSPRKLSVDTK